MALRNGAVHLVNLCEPLEQRSQLILIQENLGYEYTTEDPHYAPQYNGYYDPNVHGTMADTYNQGGQLQQGHPPPHNYYNTYSSGYSADPQQRYSTADSNAGTYPGGGVYPGYHPMPENQVRNLSIL